MRSRNRLQRPSHGQKKEKTESPYPLTKKSAKLSSLERAERNLLPKVPSSEGTESKFSSNLPKKHRTKKEVFRVESTDTPHKKGSATQKNNGIRWNDCFSIGTEIRLWQREESYYYYIDRDYYIGDALASVNWNFPVVTKRGRLHNWSWLKQRK